MNKNNIERTDRASATVPSPKGAGRGMKQVMAIMAGCFVAGGAHAALIVDQINQTIETNGVNGFAQGVSIAGAGGQQVEYQNSPSLYIRWYGGSFHYWDGVSTPTTAGTREVFFQAADGDVSFPTVSIGTGGDLSDFSRFTFGNVFQNGAESGENFMAVSTSNGDYGWLSFDVDAGNSTAITLNYFAYDDQANSPATAPSLGSAAVPEPSAALLLGLSGLGLLARRRRK